MKTNVKYLGTVYNINPDKGKVHCLLEFSIDLSKIPGIEYISMMSNFQKFIEDISNKYTGFCAFKYNNTDSIDYGTLIFQSDGLASCGPNDDFDVVLGKKIANTRAQKNSFIIARFIYEEIINMIQQSFYNSICQMYANCNYVIGDCKNHEYNLINY